jgi:hypothetical protein
VLAPLVHGGFLESTWNESHIAPRRHDAAHGLRSTRETARPPADTRREMAFYDVMPLTLSIANYRIMSLTNGSIIMAGATNHLVSVSKKALDDITKDHPKVNIPCGATVMRVLENGFGADAFSSNTILLNNVTSERPYCCITLPNYSRVYRQ